MSTLETTAETPAPAAPKKSRKKPAKPAPVEPIEDISEPIEPEPEPHYESIIIEEGYSFWQMLRSFGTGFFTGVISTSLAFGYLRAREIQKAQEEFTAAVLAADQQRAMQPPASPPSASA